jgi:aminoglycoside/choline kinase family phosphotransferase
VLEPRVRVPALIADDGRGNQIVEDLGFDDLAARCAASPAERPAWLERAADAAAAIAKLADPGINAPFDATLFRRELDLAREAVFEMYLAAPLSPADRDAHDGWADALVNEILGHPFALCHRDFHGNNLFAVSDRVAVIDFQDLRRGPDSYDLASFLWERTTLDWMDDAQAAAVVARFAERRRADAAALGARMQRVLLQRAWKVCGTFARAVVKGKGDTYRRYLPGELGLVRRLLGDSSEDRRFGEVLESRSRLGLLS